MEYEKSSNRTRYSSSVPVNVPLMNRSRAEFRKKLPEDDDHVSTHYSFLKSQNAVPLG